MNPSISITDRNDKYDRPQSSNHPNCLDPLLEWSGDIDKKWLQEIQLRPGRELVITDFIFSDDVTL